jgi:hypothetical protein
VGMLYITVCQASSHMCCLLFYKSLLFVVLDVSFIRYDLFSFIWTPCVVIGRVMTSFIFAAFRKWAFICMFLWFSLNGLACYASKCRDWNVCQSVCSLLHIETVYALWISENRKCSEKSLVKKWKAIIG